MSKTELITFPAHHRLLCSEHRPARSLPLQIWKLLPSCLPLSSQPQSFVTCRSEVSRYPGPRPPPPVPGRPLTYIICPSSAFLPLVFLPYGNSLKCRSDYVFLTLKVRKSLAGYLLPIEDKIENPLHSP